MTRIASWLHIPDIVPWTLQERHKAFIENALQGSSVVICPDRSTFTEALSDAEIALVWKFSQEFFDTAPHLRWIATPSAGRDYFCVTPPSGVEITYGTFHGELMAETVLAMMLAAARGVLESARLQFKDPWPRPHLSARMRALRGSHLVVLGFGRIGEWIARLAKPFGVRITGVRRSTVALPDYFDASDRIITPDELDSVLPETDHLALALPGGGETDAILDATRIALLPPQAWIYNVGRGNAIDEDALIGALQTNALAGACLDVFQTEPLPLDAPIRHAPNLYVLPHASAISPNYLDLWLEEFVAHARARGY